MRLFFAGADSNEKYNEVLRDKGGLHRLESFHSLKKNAPSKNFRLLLLDSGGFVARNKGINISVQNYARYIKMHNVKLAFNLDTNSLDETLANQIYLEKNTEAYILPIYHGSDYLGDDRELIDDFLKYPYIGIGGVAGVTEFSKEKQKEFFKYVFQKTRDKVRVHGLGITSKIMLELYPWYSCDSTSWLSAARFGNTKITNDNRVALYYARNQHYLENTAQEAEWWVALELYITKLWRKRNIEWTDLSNSVLIR